MEGIYEQLEKEIMDYLTPLKSLYKKQLFDFKMEQDTFGIEVRGYCKDPYTPEKKMEFLLLRIEMNYVDKQIYIPNIFLPDFMRYQGIGKKLIYKIFLIAEKADYDLFIVDMVDSFYQRMKKRGAVPYEDDVVMITSTTKLVDDVY